MINGVEHVRVMRCSLHVAMVAAVSLASSCATVKRWRGGDEGMVEGRRGQGGYGCCRGAAVGCDPCNSLRGA